MKILKTRADLKEWLLENPNPHFVPTMGALHEGHLSLVSAAKSGEHSVLISVFVNPRQFAPNEDFDQYPRNEINDAELLKNAGADAVFFPSEQEIYTSDANIPDFLLPPVFGELEGKIRPTHFLGVTQVLFRFFQLIEPAKVFFGQKDFQQTVLVRWLLEQYFPKIVLEICPIIREENGLARSSRNEYLSAENREKAMILSKVLQQAQNVFENGERNPRILEEKIREMLSTETAIVSVDYAEIRSASDLKRLEMINSPAVALLAVRFGGVRLLDNILISKNNSEILSP